MFTIPNAADAADPNQAEPDKVDIDILVAALAGNGVLNGCEVTALTSAGLAVRVASGDVQIESVEHEIDGGDLALAAAETNPRFDLVVALDDTGTGVEIVQGVSAAEPVFPEVPAGAVALAAVFVPAEAAETLDDHVVDKRCFVVPVSGGNPSVSGHNLLINGGFQINQRATTSAQADDTYGHDCWYRLTQSNAIAVSTLTDVENGLPFMARLTQSNASAQRMGYAQIIEGKNCKHLRGQQATFRIGRTRLSTSANIRFAVLEWTGTEDVVTSDVVNDWTSGIYTAGNFFLGSNLTVSGVAQQALTANTLTDGDALTVTLGSSFNNLIVFAWTEGTVAQNVTFDLGRVKLESGASATSFEWRGLQDEFQKCLRYYFRLTPEATGDPLGSGFHVLTTLSHITYFFPNVMRVAPAVFEQSGLATDYSVLSGATPVACSSVPTSPLVTKSAALVLFTVASGLTVGQGTRGRANNGAAGYLGWSADL